MPRHHHKKAKLPTADDWRLTLFPMLDGQPPEIIVRGALLHRDKWGGYTFRDMNGIVFDAPPGVVAYVQQVELEPQVPEAAAADA